MKTMTIRRFCEKHSACQEGRAWALAHCETMQGVWDHPTLKSDWMLWVATRPGVLSDRELRLFGCWCVRQVWDLLTDPRSKVAVEVSERYANGEATMDDLAAASDAAWAAARAAARAAAGAAAWAAARAAARAAASDAADAAGAAAWDAARAAARAAASDAADAAGAAAWDAARAAARAAQMQYLRENTHPNFCEVAP